MNQHFDFNGQTEPYSFVLSYPDHRHLGELVNITDRKVNELMNGPDEISFTIHRYADGVEEELWDQITSLQYIYVPQLDEYFLIEVELDDGDGVVKTISGVGAGESELAQSLIYSLEINSDVDIARDDYEHPTVFYAPGHPEYSLLNRALDKLPNWSVGHVDGTIQSLQRTFSVNNQDLYSFLTDDVAKEIDCLFKFDSVNRQINAYDLKTNCRKCGHRGTYDTKCPKCGSKDLSNYGKDTTIFVDSENLATDLNLTTDIDSIKNCFRMVAGDDNMTAAIENQNPNGSPYIYYFSPENKELMPKELVTQIENYEKLVASYEKEYQQLAKNIYIKYDKIMELTSTMMPGEKFPPTTAEKEGARLTAENLSPLGYQKLSPTTKIETINNAMIMWVRAHLQSGGYQIKIREPSFVYNGLDSDGTTSGTWTGKFELTNYSDKDDTFTTVPVSIKIWSQYGKYLEQRLEKLLSQYNRKEKGNIYDPLKMESLEEFEKACKTYCLNRLKSFADAIDGCLVLMTQEGISVENPTKEKKDLKEKVYDPFLRKLEIVQAEIDVRNGEIDAEQEKLDKYLERHRQIQKILNFRDYLGEELYSVFLIYKREQTYDNSNYISTDLDNVTIWENASLFVETAKEELFKSATYQHQISGSLIDFLSMSEFKDMAENFELGNWIRVRIADDVYRLRLIRIGFNFDEQDVVELDWSDVTQTKNGGDDLASVLSQANSIAGTYSYVKTQVRKSKEQTDLMKQFVDRGLDTTTVNIINTADNPEISVTERGLVARSYNEFTQSYDPEEIRLINNGIYFTNDNWATARAGLGHFVYYNPETGQEEDGFGIIADQLVGNVLITKEVGIYNEDNSIRLDGNGFTFSADCTDGQNKNIFNISKRYKDAQGEVQKHDILKLDTDGDLIFDGSSIKINLTGSLTTQTFNEALSGENLARAINESGAVINGGKVSVDPDTIRLVEKNLIWTADKSSLKADGTLTANNAAINGSFRSDSSNTTATERPYIEVKDGQIVGGINADPKGTIVPTADGWKVTGTLTADSVKINGQSGATESFDILVVTGKDEDGNLITESKTLSFANGVLT